MAIRRFKLTQDFLGQYTALTPAWGFTDEAGNSMGEITFLRSYSRLKEDGSKETWQDTVQRVIEGMFTIQREHCRKNQLPWDYKKAQRSAQDAYDRMFHFKWLPPGRGIANMGANFVIDEWDGTPLQNCAFISTKVDFSDAMHFLMLASMNGVGVGLDVLGAGRHQVKLRKDNTTLYQVPDTREGWAEALKLLLDSYLTGEFKIEFDYSLVRPKGAPIARFGGTASGPESLSDLLDWLNTRLEERVGAALTTTDIADIANQIGCCVVSGSSRRSAELLLGPQTDEYMDLKNYGGLVKNESTGKEEWVAGPAVDRASWGWMSNNSVLADVGQNYSKVAERTRINGEPGYVWMDVTRGFGRMKDRRDDKDWRAAGYNPCAEQPLESWEMCTLVETYPTRAESVDDFLKTLKVAYLYAKTVTLLPTVFERTNAVMARNRRIGLSQTGITTYVEQHGIAQWRKLSDEGYKYIAKLDNIYSEWLCIRNSIRTTTVKPSGTVSILTGDSPGVHWNPASGYYIRRMTMGDGELVETLRAAGYQVDPSFYSKGQWVVSFPIKSPFHRSEKDVSIWEKVAIAAEAQHWWSDNSVSVTVSYDPETEGKHIASILSLYEGRLKTVSFLPIGKDTYQQMPYEEITEEVYEDMCLNLMPVDKDLLYQTGVEAEGEKFCNTTACLTEVPEVKV
jgi:ribonucleoside-triphosphate reductase